MGAVRQLTRAFRHTLGDSVAKVVNTGERRYFRAFGDGGVAQATKDGIWCIPYGACAGSLEWIGGATEA